MIELKNLSLGYPQKLLIENLTTKFQSGTLTALIGRNGSGKSTLLKAICGLNDKFEGEIFISGENLRTLSKPQLSRLLSFVNTSRPRIANLSCRDIVALGRAPYTDWIGNLSNKDKSIVDESLEAVGMSDYANRTIDSLSDGESQRIMIARALAQDTKIIILDEPTSFLDLPTRFEVVELLKRLTVEKGKTILFSTHELDIALEIADRIAILDNKTIYNDTVESTIKSGRIQKLFKTPGNFLDRLLNSISPFRSGSS